MRFFRGMASATASATATASASAAASTAASTAAWATMLLWCFASCHVATFYTWWLWIADTCHSLNTDTCRTASASATAFAFASAIASTAAMTRATKWFWCFSSSHVATLYTWRLSIVYSCNFRTTSA